MWQSEEKRPELPGLFFGVVGGDGVSWGGINTEPARWEDAAVGRYRIFRCSVMERPVREASKAPGARLRVRAPPLRIHRSGLWFVP